MENWVRLEISSGKPWNGKGDWGKLTWNFGIAFLSLLTWVVMFRQEAVAGYSHDAILTKSHYLKCCCHRNKQFVKTYTSASENCPQVDQ